MPEQEKKVMGRPERVLTDEQFEQLIEMVRIQCTQEEVCSVFDMDQKTLNKILKDRGEQTFSVFYKKYSGEGKKSLRRAQWHSATEDKNPTMLVWLGKQMLGQKDKHEVEGNFTINLPGHALDL